MESRSHGYRWTHGTELGFNEGLPPYKPRRFCLEILDRQQAVGRLQTQQRTSRHEGSAPQAGRGGPTSVAVLKLEQPAANERKWEAQAKARARVSELTAMVREHMGPDEQHMSVAEYVEKHAPDEPRTDIERVMFLLKHANRRAKERHG